MLLTIFLLLPKHGASQATDYSSHTVSGDSDVTESDTLFSWNVEFYLAKPELEEYPETALPKPPEPALFMLPKEEVVVLLSDLPSRTRCSCVEGTRHFSGFQTAPMGFAYNHPVNILTPVVGAIVKTNESSAGHVATITEVSDLYIEVIETNYVSCQVTLRKIYYNSGVIKGFYNEAPEVLEVLPDVLKEAV